MTRSFSKSTSNGPLKLTALCLAIALGWAVHGAPSLADGPQQMAMDLELAMAHIC